jgi:hypothetical protein
MTASLLVGLVVLRSGLGMLDVRDMFLFGEVLETTDTLLVGFVVPAETTDVPTLLVLSVSGLGMLDVRDNFLLGGLLGEVLGTTDVPPLLSLGSALAILALRRIVLLGGLVGEALDTTDVPPLLSLGSALAILALRRIVLLGGLVVLVVGAIFILVVVLTGDESA